MQKPLNVLVVEDNASDFRLLERHLRHHGLVADCLRVGSRAELDDALARGDWQVVLSDYAIPGFGFDEVLERLEPRLPDLPLILVSGNVGEERAVELLKRGVWDFVLKDNLSRLVPAIERSLGDAIERRARRQAENALRESEERLARVVETAASGILLADAEGIITLANPAAERILGWTRSSLVGRHLHDPAWKVASGDGQPVPTGGLPCERVLGSGGPIFGAEVSQLRSDGVRIVLLYNLALSRDGAGRPNGMVASFDDITERRQLEGQLRQAQKMEAVGQLAGGVAHDFNNILASILMQVELTAMTDPLPPEVADGLKQVRSDAQRAANLTRQLLLFGRRQPMMSRELNLNQAVNDMARMLRRIIGEDVRLDLALHPTPLVTYADAGMIEQLLMNLVVNARDAMPGGGRLEIATGEEQIDEVPRVEGLDAVPGRYLRLAVSDTGCGIPAEVLPRIFEPFFTTKETGRGSGLGLATVFGIVKQHRGWIRVDSRPGRGSVFTVYLPASREVDRAWSSGGARPGAAGPPTVLLVEDDDSLRMLMRATLERHGFRVLAAADGVEAIEIWQQYRDGVSVLLTDLVMPAGISGQQLADHLLADRPELRVIYISGHSPNFAGRELRLREGEIFLPKPCLPADLLAAVRRCLPV